MNFHRLECLRDEGASKVLRTLAIKKYNKARTLDFSVWRAFAIQHENPAMQILETIKSFLKRKRVTTGKSLGKAACNSVLSVSVT